MDYTERSRASEIAPMCHLPPPSSEVVLAIVDRPAFGARGAADLTR